MAPLPANGAGDSGGPVFTSSAYPPPTNASVYAIGIISGGSRQVGCSVYKPYRTCYKTAFVVDMQTIASRYSVKVKVP